MSKEVTYERAATMLERAIEGSRRLELDDAADRYEDMSVEDYIEEKGLVLTNPAPVLLATQIQKRSTTMTTNDPRTKDQIIEDEQATLGVADDSWDRLVDLDENSSKEDLLDAIEDVLDMWNEFDTDRFPIDDNEEDQEQDEAA